MSDYPDSKTDTKRLLYLPRSVDQRIRDIATIQKKPISEVLRDAIVRSLPPQESDRDPVAFLLRDGERTDRPSWSNGGRWLLDWLLLREPSWQERHLVMLPRPRPIPLNAFEDRCDANAGDRRSINVMIRELVNGDLPAMRFPPDLPLLTVEQWNAVCARYTGCCGERLRPPSGPHWDAACPH